MKQKLQPLITRNNTNNFFNMTSLLVKISVIRGLYSACVAVFSFSGLNAQPGFQKHLSEYIDYSGFSLSSIDSSYVLAGSRWDAGSFYDFCAAKLDKNGSILWSKTFPSSGNEYLGRVIVSPSGQIVLSGYRADSAGVNQLSLMKLDKSGAPLWLRTYGNSNQSIFRFAGETAAGDIYLVGNLDQTERFRVIKTDNSGTLLWNKAFGSSSADEQMLGGTVTKDGGLALMGTLPSYKTFLMKLNPDGTIAWANSYISSHIQLLSSIKQTNDGGFVLASADCRCDANGCRTYFAFIKLDSSGNVSWARAAEGVPGEARDIFEISSGEIGITGQLQYLGNYHPALILTTSSGTMISARIYGAPGTAGEIFYSEEVPEGGFAFTGTDNAVTSFYKTDANGSTGCNEMGLSPVFSVMGFIKSSPLSIASMTDIIYTAHPSAGMSAYSLSDSLVCSALGINEETRPNDVVIYPNPTTGAFQVQSSKFQVQGISITNVLGEMVPVQTKSRVHGILNCDLGSCPRGIYFYEVRDTEKVIGTGKLLAE